MMNSTEHKTLLEPGWGYFHIQRVEDKKPDGSPLLSKNGSPMIKLGLMVADITGASARIYDWVTSDTDWKISNLEEVFKISNLYQNGRFNKELILGKTGICSMKTQSNPSYGESTSISMYVPLEFLKIKEEDLNEGGLRNIHTGEVIKGPFVGIEKKSHESIVNHPSPSLPDDDDIPF